MTDELNRHVLYKAEFDAKMQKDASEMIQWLLDEEEEEEEEEGEEATEA